MNPLKVTNGKQLKREIPVKQTGVYYKSKPKPWVTLLVFKPLKFGNFDSLPSLPRLYVKDWLVVCKSRIEKTTLSLSLFVKQCANESVC